MNEKAILLDADVIIHFCRGGEIGKLPYIFPNNKLLVLDKVLEELTNWDEFRVEVENMLKYSIITEIAFPSNPAIVKEYAALVKKHGKGEAASMAVCRFNKNILASSNLTDILDYCNFHGIQYLTTMDFIATAYDRKVMDEPACDLFIYNVLSKNSKLPCRTIKEYTEGIRIRKII